MRRADSDPINCQSRWFLQRIVKEDTSFKKPVDNCLIDGCAENVLKSYFEVENNFVQVTVWCCSSESDVDLVKDALSMHFVNMEPLPWVSQETNDERYTN